MPDEKQYEYSSREGEEEEGFRSISGLRQSHKSKTSRWSWILYAPVMGISLLAGGIVGFSLRQVSPGTGLALQKPLISASVRNPNLIVCASTYDIDDGITFEFREQRFNGSLFHRSAYSGPPSLKMNETWGRFTEAGSSMLVKIPEGSMPDYPPVLNISTDDARASTSYSLRTAVRLNETQNMGYMASLGFFHQIHCLNMLRKFIHLDYYAETEPEWYRQPYLQEHADHCVDMLREAIMCHGDTTLIVYHWVDHQADPVPDFSTPHTCRNPEDILDWMQINQVTLKNAVYKHGEEELPEIF